MSRRIAFAAPLLNSLTPSSFAQVAQGAVSPETLQAFQTVCREVNYTDTQHKDPVREFAPQ
jgi:hypothetical protein